MSRQTFTAATPVLPPYDHTPRPYAGPSIEEVRQMRQTYLTPALVTYYRDPIMIVEGSMQYLYDEKGRRYLDAFGGIVTVSVGHCHPHVTEAVCEQVRTLQHATTIYLHPVIAEYGKLLASKLPGDLSVCYFVNSGSEANDLALLMARLHTGNYDVIALRNAYHGGSPSAMGLTSHHTWKFNVPHTFGIQHAVNAGSVPRAVGTGRSGGRPQVRRGCAGADPLWHLRPGGRRSSPSPSRAWAARWSFPTATWRRSTPMSARRAASASPTKCRPVSDARARTSGASKRRA